jgi:hypothetical protein
MVYFVTRRGLWAALVSAESPERALDILVERDPGWADVCEDCEITALDPKRAEGIISYNAPAEEKPKPFPHSHAQAELRARDQWLRNIVCGPMAQWGQSANRPQLVLVHGFHRGGYPFGEFFMNLYFPRTAEERRKKMLSSAPWAGELAHKAYLERWKRLSTISVQFEMARILCSLGREELP